MKLAMTLLVRNEEDVVEANVRFHLDRGVDMVVAMDNGSSDATAEILRSFEREGVMRVVECPAPEEFRQAEYVTLLARLAAVEHGADWVIDADADEFWWPLAGSLKDVLEAVPDDWDVLEVPRSDFLPAAEDDGPFHQRLVVRETRSISPTGWPLLPKVAHRAHPEIEVATGNHSVIGPWTRAAHAHGLIEVLHFPLRDYKQFERKVVQTGEAFAQTPSVPTNAALDQRELYRLAQEGRLREYYEQRVLDDPAVETGLADGSLVVDRRLAEFFSRRSDGPATTGTSPDGPALRSVTGAALGFLAAREALHASEARVAENEALLADARLEIDALDRSVRELREDLVRESAALAALRGSRVVRYTRAARAVYYGVRRRFNARA